MQRSRITIVVSLVALLTSMGDKIKSKGLITNHTGDTLIVETAAGPYTVILARGQHHVSPVLSS